MKEYDFTLKYHLPKPSDNAETYIEALEDNGCTDALIGIGKAGQLSLDFSREATSAFSAITSAIADVQRAIPDAVLIESTPDFVGISDIADIYGSTRQNIRKLLFSKSATFPAPIHDGNPTLWHLADVLHWFTSNDPHRFSEELIEISRINMQVNLYRSYLKASSFTETPIQFEAPTPNKAVEWDNFFRYAFGYARKPASHG